MKRTVNKILIGTLSACLSFNITNVYATSMKTENNNSIQVKFNGVEKAANPLGDHSEQFDAVPGGSYEYNIASGYNSGYGSITFSERADNFKLILRNNSNGSVGFLKTYFLAGPVDGNVNAQGVERITFRLNMDGKSEYALEVVNEDTVIISGNLNLKY